MCISVFIRFLFDGDHCHNWGQSPVHEGLLLQFCIKSCMWMLVVMCQTLKTNVSLLQCVLQLLRLASRLLLASHVLHHTWLQFTPYHQSSPHLTSCSSHLTPPHLTCDQPGVDISPHLINLNIHHITSPTKPHPHHLTSPSIPHLTPSQLPLLLLFIWTSLGALGDEACQLQQT